MVSLKNDVTDFCEKYIKPVHPQNWDWYHNQFLGAGQYEGNTWRPTSAILKMEKKGHPSLKKLEKEFTTAPNEWYSWEHDLRQNPDIEILLAISEKSYPLGTGPKNHEIWYCGYYPVMWTNKKYKMSKKKIRRRRQTVFR